MIPKLISIPRTMHAKRVANKLVRTEHENMIHHYYAHRHQIPPEGIILPGAVHGTRFVFFNKNHHFEDFVEGNSPCLWFRKISFEDNEMILQYFYNEQCTRPLATKQFFQQAVYIIKYDPIFQECTLLDYIDYTNAQCDLLIQAWAAKIALLPQEGIDLPFSTVTRRPRILGVYRDLRDYCSPGERTIRVYRRLIAENGFPVIEYYKDPARQVPLISNSRKRVARDVVYLFHTKQIMTYSEHCIEQLSMFIYAASKHIDRLPEVGILCPFPLLGKEAKILTMSKRFYHSYRTKEPWECRTYVKVTPSIDRDLLVITYYTDKNGRSPLKGNKYFHPFNIITFDKSGQPIFLHKKEYRKNVVRFFQALLYPEKSCLGPSTPQILTGIHPSMIDKRKYLRGCHDLTDRSSWITYLQPKTNDLTGQQELHYFHDRNNTRPLKTRIRKTKKIDIVNYPTRSTLFDEHTAPQLLTKRSSIEDATLEELISTSEESSYAFHISLNIPAHQAMLKDDRSWYTEAEKRQEELESNRSLRKIYIQLLHEYMPVAYRDRKIEAFRLYVFEKNILDDIVIILGVPLGQVLKDIKECFDQLHSEQVKIKLLKAIKDSSEEIVLNSSLIHDLDK